MSPAGLDALARQLVAIQRGARETVRKAAEVEALRAESTAKGLLGGARLTPRTGHLRRSVQGRATIKSDVPTATLRAGGDRDDVRYARIHDVGGVITPKRGRFLAIPVGAALTASGVPRYSSPRQVAGLRFIPTRGGRAGILVRDVGGRNARSEVLFRLVRQVRINATRYLSEPFDTLRERLPLAIRAAFTHAMVPRE